MCDLCASILLRSIPPPPKKKTWLKKIEEGWPFFSCNNQLCFLGRLGRCLFFFVFPGRLTSYKTQHPKIIFIFFSEKKNEILFNYKWWRSSFSSSFFIFIFYQETQPGMMFQNHFDYSFPAGQGNELLPPFWNGSNWCVPFEGSGVGYIL